MVFIYIFIILVATFPVVLTIIRMRRAAEVTKNGIHTDAFVTDTETIRIKNTRYDNVRMEYKDRTTGRNYSAKMTSAVGRFRRGDRVTIAYLPSKPSVYAVEGYKKGYIVVLVFTILLLAFAIFAVYKINEMVHSG